MEKITIKTDYITLGQLLKFASIVGSGGEVKIFLQEYDIYLNGELEKRRGKKLYPNDKILINSVMYQVVKNEN